MKLVRYATLVGMMALLLLLVSCGSGNDEAAQTETAQPQEETASSGDATLPSGDEAVPETLAARSPEPEKPKEEKPKPKPATTTVAKKPEPKPEEPPKPTMVSIPLGTAMTVALATRLSTDSNQVGDSFSGMLAEPVMIDGKVALETGTRFYGKLTKVEEPHRTSGRAQLTLAFDKLVTADGEKMIVTEPIELIAEGDKVSDEGKVAIGGAVGGIIGAMTSKKKGKGAAIGAAAGAAAGGAIAVATKGKQLELLPDQRFSVQLVEAVEVAVVKNP